jgi:hypothetical protein
MPITAKVSANFLLKIGFWNRAEDRVTWRWITWELCLENWCVPYQKINVMRNCILKRKNYKFKGILFRVWVRSWKVDKTFTVCLGSEVLTAVIMKSSVFRGVTPCSPSKFNRRFGGTCYVHLQGRKISRSRTQREASSKQIVKMEPTCSFETSVDFQRTTWRYITEDRNFLFSFPF